MIINKTMAVVVQVACALFLSCTVSKPLVYQNNQAFSGLSESAAVAYVPLADVHALYRDNMSPLPQREFSDSFMTEATNQMFAFALMQHFSNVAALGDSIVQSFGSAPKYSIIMNDTTNRDSASFYYRELALQTGASIIAVSLQCSIRDITNRPEGFREDKYGKVYERPIQHKSVAEFYVQLWNAKGELIYEKLGSAQTNAPMLYSLLKNDPSKVTSVVKYASTFYASPLVKALHKAISSALSLNTR